MPSPWEYKSIEEKAKLNYEELTNLEDALIAFSKIIFSLKKGLKYIVKEYRQYKSIEIIYSVKYIESYENLDYYIKCLESKKSKNAEDAIIYKDKFIFLVDRDYFKSIEYITEFYNIGECIFKCINYTEYINTFELGLSWNHYYGILIIIIQANYLKNKIDNLLINELSENFLLLNEYLELLEKYDYKFVCKKDRSRCYENQNLIPFGYTLANMRTGLFAEYIEAGKILGLNNKQAKFFAATALELSRKEIIDITETDNDSLGALKKGVGKKLGFNNELQVYKDPLIKELAQSLENADVLEAAKKVYQSSIRDKIGIAKEYAENKRLADMLRANPELLQALQQMNQPTND